MMPFLRSVGAACALFWVAPLTGLADPLGVPTGKVVLTVTGDISETNVDGAAQFDMATLQGMDPAEISTSTIWTDGQQTFKGVLLKTLFEMVGAKGSTVMAFAINDYAIEIPMSDAVEDGPILAYALNGDAMSVREKGPLWIVYPYDARPEYQTEVIYARSIWQVDRIEVVNQSVSGLH